MEFDKKECKKHERLIKEVIAVLKLHVMSLVRNSRSTGGDLDTDCDVVVLGSPETGMQATILLLAVLRRL